MKPRARELPLDPERTPEPALASAPRPEPAILPTAELAPSRAPAPELAPALAPEAEPEPSRAPMAALVFALTVTPEPQPALATTPEPALVITPEPVPALTPMAAMQSGGATDPKLSASPGTVTEAGVLAFDDDPGPIEIVDEMSLDGAVDEFEPAIEVGIAEDDRTIDSSSGLSEVPDAPADDPFARLVGALEETALALGGGDSCVSHVRALFGVTRWDGIDPGPQALDALLAGQLIVRSESRQGTARASGFTAQVLAWQGILRGESEDFALCTALDEWAADVLARVLGNPGRADAIRRELRARGVAAFGLVADAA